MEATILELLPEPVADAIRQAPPTASLASLAEAVTHNLTVPAGDRRQTVRWLRRLGDVYCESTEAKEFLPGGDLADPIPAADMFAALIDFASLVGGWGLTDDSDGHDVPAAWDHPSFDHQVADSYLSAVYAVRGVEIRRIVEGVGE